MTDFDTIHLPITVPTDSYLSKVPRYLINIHRKQENGKKSVAFLRFSAHIWLEVMRWQRKLDFTDALNAAVS